MPTAKTAKKYPRRRICKNPFKSVFNVADIRACKPCYDPVKLGVLPEGWRGTLRDLIEVPTSRFTKARLHHRARNAVSDKQWAFWALVWKYYARAIYRRLGDSQPGYWFNQAPNLGVLRRRFIEFEQAMYPPRTKAA